MDQTGCSGVPVRRGGGEGSGGERAMMFRTVMVRLQDKDGGQEPLI
jgi:hypothetical protein